MPFDWLRISLPGVISALRNDFIEFLNFDSVTGYGTSYVASDRQFFHDVLADPREHVKYQRRFKRFRDLRNKGMHSTGAVARRILFVRVADATAELIRAEELYADLVKFFDDSVYLLLILDCQHQDCTIIFDRTPRIMLQTVGRHHGRPAEYEIDRPPFVSAYREPLLQAAWYAEFGWLPADFVRFPTLEALLEDGERRGLIRHVSLGEDLDRYNYGIPQMPPDKALLAAMDPQTAKYVRESTEGSVQARRQWEAASGSCGVAPGADVRASFVAWMDSMAD